MKKLLKKLFRSIYNKIPFIHHHNIRVLIDCKETGFTGEYMGPGLHEKEYMVQGYCDCEAEVRINKATTKELKKLKVWKQVKEKLKINIKAKINDGE